MAVGAAAPPPTAAADLSACVHVGAGTLGLVALTNDCPAAVRVTYRFASQNDRNQWVDLSPGATADVADAGEASRAGGLVWVTCPAGVKALEGDGSGPWYGRNGAFVCR